MSTGSSGDLAAEAPEFLGLETIFAPSATVVMPDASCSVISIATISVATSAVFVSAATDAFCST